MAIGSRKWQVDPLQHDIKIAEADGSGTPWLIRQWNLLLALVKQVTSLSQPSGVTPGTYGDATNVAQVTVDEFGRVTNAQNVPIDVAGAEWSLIGSWTFSGAVASVPFDVSGMTDIIVMARAVDPVGTTRLCMQVSTDGGATYYTTSGNYVILTVDGVETNVALMPLYVTNSAAARSAFMQMNGLNTGAAMRPVYGTIGATFTYMFVASTDDINHIRLVMEDGSNFAGGTIQVLGR